MCREGTYNIALRQYAGQAPSRAAYHKRADAVRRQKLDRRSKVRGRFNTDDIAAQVFGGQDRLYVHGSLLRPVGQTPRIQVIENDPPRARFRQYATMHAS
jgi:hypothetical protein